MSHELVPPSVAWIPKAQLYAMCNRSRSVVEERINALKQLRESMPTTLADFEYDEYQRGISRESANIVILFNQLVIERGAYNAVKALPSELKKLGEYDNEHGQIKPSCCTG